MVKQTSFIISLTDINVEKIPRLSVLNRPTDGKFWLKTINLDRTIAKSIQYEIRWENIGASRIGTEQILDFKACAHATRTMACKTFSVALDFVERDIALPRFDRSDWPLGTIKRHKVGTFPLKVPFTVSDPTTGEIIDDFDIEVSHVALNVYWTSGKLFVGSLTPGIYQFNIRARTKQGIEGVESMVVEIFEPKTNRFN